MTGAGPLTGSSRNREAPPARPVLTWPHDIHRLRHPRGGRHRCSRRLLQHRRSASTPGCASAPRTPRPPASADSRCRSIASQPANVHALFDAAVAAGATILKPVENVDVGCGGVVQAPRWGRSGISRPRRRRTPPRPRASSTMIALLVAAEDVGASKRFYKERGFEVRQKRRIVRRFRDPGRARSGSGCTRAKPSPRSAGVVAGRHPARIAW